MYFNWLLQRIVNKRHWQSLPQSSLVQRKQLFTINPVFLKSLATRFEQIMSVHYQGISHHDNKNLKFPIFLKGNKLCKITKNWSQKFTEWSKPWPGIMYGFCKVHGKCVDGCPPFRPILYALQTLTYKLVKYLVPILEPLTTNKYTKICVTLPMKLLSKIRAFSWVA